MKKQKTDLIKSQQQLRDNWDDSLCNNCGLCCSYYIKHNGFEVALPSYKCMHRQDDKCAVYETRKCPREEDILIKAIVPHTCPYTKSIKDYVGRLIASPSEEEQIYKYLSDKEKDLLAKGFEPK